MLPRSSSGTHITDVSFRLTTDSEFLNSSSFSASEMMIGLCVLTTFAMIESDSWRTASEIVSRRRLRATLTTRLARLHQHQEALVGVGHRDHHVEQLIEQGRQLVARHQLVR